jgi:hypothetical protein
MHSIAQYAMGNDRLTACRTYGFANLPWRRSARVIWSRSRFLTLAFKREPNIESETSLIKAALFS